MKNLVATLSAVSLGATGVALAAPAEAGTPSTAISTSHHSRISWAACTDPGLQEAGAQCGYLSVPLDHARPHGKHIRIAVSRVKHTVPDSQYQGVMLVNPGGPGGSGLGLVTLGQYVPHGAGAAYDWIGFDPRGVGSSKPALSCLPNYFHPDRPPYVPTRKWIQRVWLHRAAAYAAACGRHGGELLDHVKTTDTVRDMDSIRRALGVKRINYFGYSYGTYLGQVYSTLFPHRVRRMVLDSNVDPRRVWYRANLDQDVAFNRNLNIFFGWVARYDAVYHLGSTRRAVARQFYETQRALRAHPAGGVVGSSEWNDTFVLAGYVQFLWPDLADAFAGWVHDGDAKTLIGWYEAADGPGDDNYYAMYNATQCTDVRWPGWHKTRNDAWRTYRKAPFLTWNNTWYNAPCLTWPAKPGTPVKVDGRQAPPILLIDETLDAATPFQGSLEVRRLFPKSRLLAEPGGTSHAFSLSGNACVDNTVARYLAHGTLPARKPGSNRWDKTCAPLPQPVPTELAAGAARTAAPNAAIRAQLLKAVVR